MPPFRKIEGVNFLWTSRWIKSGQVRVINRPESGAEKASARKFRRKRVVHETFHNVEKNCKIFHNEVEKKDGMCYNVGMKDKQPDFSVVKELIETNRDKFDAFYELLLFYNTRYNLTAITAEKEVYFKHFMDSLAGEHLFLKGARVLEVGSGAGFPSVPLMIARKDLTFTLVESTGKKCDFLRTAQEKLGLNAEVIHTRAEELAKDPAYREQYDVCCARAVARLNTLSEYCLPFVKRGGAFIAYKGEAQEEAEEARKAIALLGGGEAELIRYSLPEGYGARTLIFVQKCRETPLKYPRGQGKERSRPII